MTKERLIELAQAMLDARKAYNDFDDNPKERAKFDTQTAEGKVGFDLIANRLKNKLTFAIEEYNSALNDFLNPHNKTKIDY